MPRYRRKRWKRFMNKVHAVSERDLGSRTVVMNVSATFYSKVANYQGVGSVALYPQGSTASSWLNDLTNISALENSGDPTAAAGTTVLDTTNFIFKSGVLDITIRNTSGLYVSDGVYTLDSQAKIELDIYEITARKQFQTGTTVYHKLETALEYGGTLTNNLAGGGTAIELARRGATPWDLPAALSYFGMTIQSKKKYFMANGDTITYQLRDPKRHVIQQERMQNEVGVNKPGWTRHVLFLFKLIPGLQKGTTVGVSYGEQIQVGVTRKYLYKIEGANDDRDQWLNS